MIIEKLDTDYYKIIDGDKWYTANYDHIDRKWKIYDSSYVPNRVDNDSDIGKEIIKALDKRT